MTKSEYNKPALTAYGDISDITQTRDYSNGGSGSTWNYDHNRRGGNDRHGGHNNRGGNHGRGRGRR